MYNEKRIVAIIAAAGQGSRMKRELPKQFLKIHGEPMLAKTYKAIADCQIVDEIFVVTKDEHLDHWKELVLPRLNNSQKSKLGGLITGGDERQESMYKALTFLREENIDVDYVLIHDAARPFVDHRIIEDVVKASMEVGGAIPYVKPKETIRTEGKTLNREELMVVQTPQGFEFDLILEAHKVADRENFIGTDDGSLIERIGVLPVMVEGNYNNIKITTSEDIKEDIRIGKGYDVHRLVDGRDCIIGGVKIPNAKGLLGHSDGDVLTHAIMDSLLGAAAMGDIGRHFPDTNGKYAGMYSIKLLKEVGRLIKDKGFTIGNIDATVICEEPKISPFIEEIILNISKTLEIEADRINIKGTTTEKLGFTGRGEGIAAEAICILKD